MGCGCMQVLALVFVLIRPSDLAEFSIFVYFFSRFKFAFATAEAQQGTGEVLEKRHTKEGKPWYSYFLFLPSCE